MTNERAIEKQKQLIDYLKYCLEIGSDCCLLDEDKKMIISALEYRTPKKVLPPEVILLENGRCPNCNCVLFDKNMKYCCRCGEALDWT